MTNQEMMICIKASDFLGKVKKRSWNSEAKEINLGVERNRKREGIMEERDLS